AAGFPAAARPDSGRFSHMMGYAAGMPLNSTPLSTRGRLSGTQALERGFRLIKEVAASDISGVRLVDLVARTGLARSTAHRLLDCMVAEGLLIRERGGRYHLGRELYDLGLLATHRYDLNGYGFGPLRTLAETLGDTVFLTRRVGLDMVCVERI